MLDSLTLVLDRLPFAEACVAFLVLNLAIFAAAVGVGTALHAALARGHIQSTPARSVARELPVALAALFVNIALTWLGLWLYRRGTLVLRRDLPLHLLVLDVAIFFFAIDALMYTLHRVAHVRWIFDLLHALHHRRDNPTVVTLWVLHPVEAVGFGGLWIILLVVHDFSLQAFVAYNVLNVLFGVIGHLGFEPFPRWWVRFPASGWITTSTFHNQHHARRDVNFGFYTTFWDRAFGTLDPAYAREFEENSLRLTTSHSG